MRVVVAFGSNLGDREQIIADASQSVSRILSQFTLSSIIETAPVGAGLENDPPYLNAVGAGDSDRPVREIFESLKRIEQDAGRTRSYPGAPRTLDLDLILAGSEVVEEDDLQVPHPRFRERLFVLDPLVDIAPDLVDPITGLSIRALRARVQKERAGG
jgi:2-amino-4-hydroxy-6-hydroxymethyldihydropteridine diphosphokinase